MARSDLAAFLGTLARTDRDLARLMGEIAHDVADVVLREAGPDGKVAVERLGEVQRQAQAVVDAAFIGPARQPFDEKNQPMSPFARIIAGGQGRMIDLALERTAAILDRGLPDDVRAQLAARQVRR